MDVMFLVFSAIMTLFFPILSIPLNIFGMIFTRGKIRKTYGFLLAFCLAIVAFSWVPDNSMDLYRHYQELRALSNFNFEKLGVYIKTSLEPMSYLIKFFVAQTGNYGLLQFIVVLIGYSELFWLLSDFAELNGVKRKLFTLLLVYAFTAIRFIDFASGLWFNLAIINIALGAYLGIFKGRRCLQYILYILAACLHIGTLYVIVAMIIFMKLKLFKKVRLSSLIGVFLMPLFFGLVVLVINNIFGSDFALVPLLNSMYESYFVNGTQFVELYAGWNLFLRLGMIALAFIMAIRFSKDTILGKYSCLLMYLAVFILSTIIVSGVFARYGFLMVILSIPLIIKFLQLSANKIPKIFLVLAILILSTFQLFRSCAQIESAGLKNQIDENITNNVFMILNKKEQAL